MSKITIVMLALLITHPAYANAITLSKIDLATIKLSEHLYFRADPNHIDTAQLITLPDEQFSNAMKAQHSPQLGDSTDYRLEFINDTNGDVNYTLQIDNPMLDKLELIFVVNKQIIVQQLLGDLIQSPFKLKNSMPHFTLKFKANTTSHVYLRVSSSGATIIPLLLHDNTSFQTQVYKTFIIWGAFIGIIIMMTAYNAILYIGIRDKIYLFYLGYILAMSLQLSIIYGFGFHIMPFDIQSSFNKIVVPLNYVTSTFAILFALYFLRYDVTKTAVYRFSLYFCTLISIIGCISLTLPEALSAKIYYPIQLAIYLLIARICIPKMANGKRWSTYYMLSWIPLFIGTTVAQLLLIGIVEHNYLTQNLLLLGLVLEIALISLALAERYRYNERTRIYHVTHDSVTGLPNQIVLSDCTNQLIADQKPFSMILFQAERFNEIKPAVGLIAANNLVTAIVKNVSGYFSAMNNLYTFEQQQNRNIHLCRINDDTFALLLLGEYQQDELSYIILTIQEAVSTPINVGGYSLSTSCSVGSVSFPQFSVSAQYLIQKAQHSLDIAKKEDTKYAFYCENHNVDIQEQLQLVADLQKAIDNDTLQIYHQPQIDLTTQTVCGNEALLRWEHETKGFISPDIFVALAEDTGIINQLTEWVIERSLEQHAKMIKAGYCQDISINLSAKDLTQPGLIAHIMTTIADLRLDPTSIVFELTESATSDDPVHALQTINQLHELNLKVAIDDFGTGYSSLEYLSKLPFHELKIDKSFVLNMLSSERDQAIIKTTIKMAKNLNIFVVAEGIETTAIEDLLRSYKCEIGQGYLYSKPLPIDDYIAWLRGDSQYVQKLKTSSNCEMTLTTVKV